eukprot:scaffold15670_cov112-Isochrysis_galbana.AAC.7
MQPAQEYALLKATHQMLRSLHPETMHPVGRLASETPPALAPGRNVVIVVTGLRRADAGQPAGRRVKAPSGRRVSSVPGCAALQAHRATACALTAGLPYAARRRALEARRPPALSSGVNRGLAVHGPTAERQATTAWVRRAMRRDRAPRQRSRAALAQGPFRRSRCLLPLADRGARLARHSRAGRGHLAASIGIPHARVRLQGWLRARPSRSRRNGQRQTTPAEDWSRPAAAEVPPGGWPSARSRTRAHAPYAPVAPPAMAASRSRRRRPRRARQHQPRKTDRPALNRDSSAASPRRSGSPVHLGYQAQACHRAEPRHAAGSCCRLGMRHRAGSPYHVSRPPRRLRRRREALPSSARSPGDERRHHVCLAVPMAPGSPTRPGSLRPTGARLGWAARVPERL